MTDTLDLLFFGDLVGRPGREAVKWYLSTLEDSKRPDVVIANVENASHGFGLTEKNYQELQAAGVDIMTGGNHIFDKKDILGYIDGADNLLCPMNIPGMTKGRGYGVFCFSSVQIGVINLIGQVYMGNYNSPWEHIERVVNEMREETNIIFVDFHAEATAEKIALANYLASLGVSAMSGTHTHVQTADNKIIGGRMGYITDSGFCGAYESVIGMVTEMAIQRLQTPYPCKMDVAESHLVQVNGTRYRINCETGICESVERVNVVHDLDRVGSLYDDHHTALMLPR